VEDPVPTYQYACTECDHSFEQFQSFTDDALTVCPQCEGRLRKVFNAVGVVFKGSGFYRTDSRKDGSQDGGKDGGKVPAAAGNGSRTKADATGSSSGEGSGSSSGEGSGSTGSSTASTSTSSTSAQGSGSAA
jgi:putative FmdB family regulatory protein